MPVFFAGVGGIDLGFRQAGFEVVYANEIDKNAVETYESNYNIKVDNRDINIVKSEEIPDFDVMVAGFPCQAFSIASLRQGFNDEQGRGILFFELERIFRDKKPQINKTEKIKQIMILFFSYNTPLFSVLILYALYTFFSNFSIFF